MNRSRTGSNSPFQVIVDYTVAGLVAGSLTGGIFFLIEPVGMYSGLAPFFGATLTRILAVYLAVGLVIGAGSGVVGGAADALLRKPGVNYRVGPVTVALSGAVFTLVFLTRDYTLPELRTMPAGLMTTAAMTVLLWGSMAVTFTRIAQRRNFAAKRQLNRAVAGGMIAVTLLAAIVSDRKARAFPTRDGASEQAPKYCARGR